MSQQQKNEFRYEGKDFVVNTQIEGGHVFVHVTANNFSKEIYKEMMDVFVQVLSFAQDLGKELIFATSEEEKSTKFWKMLSPLEDLDKFGSQKQYWIGSWHIKDTLDGIRKSTRSGRIGSRGTGPEVSVSSGS